MSSIALAGAPAVELAALVRTRAVSAVEVVEAHLRAHRGGESGDQRGRAARRGARARRGRRRLTTSREAEPPGPLHGVPFTVKDNLEAAGIPMAIGAPERVGVVPETDATAVARLRAPGRSCSGRRTARRSAAASRPTTRSTAARTTRTTSSGRRAAAAAARRRSSPPAARRSGSAPTPARACASPPTSAGSPRSSRPPAACRSPA